MRPMQVLHICSSLLLLLINVCTFLNEGLSIHLVVHYINMCTYVLTNLYIGIENIYSQMMAIYLSFMLLPIMSYIYLQEGSSIYFIISFINICNLMLFVYGEYQNKK